MLCEEAVKGATFEGRKWPGFERRTADQQCEGMTHHKVPSSASNTSISAVIAHTVIPGGYPHSDTTERSIAYQYEQVDRVPPDNVDRKSSAMGKGKVASTVIVTAVVIGGIGWAIAPSGLFGAATCVACLAAKSHNVCPF